MKNKIIIRDEKVFRKKPRVVKSKLRRFKSFILGRKIWITKVPKGSYGRFVQRSEHGIQMRKRFEKNQRKRRSPKKEMKNG